MAESEVPASASWRSRPSRGRRRLRATRTTLAQMAIMAAMPSPSGKKDRLIYDMRNQGSSFLPGKLVRSEGDPKSHDPAVNEAYD